MYNFDSRYRRWPIQVSSCPDIILMCTRLAASQPNGFLMLNVLQKSIVKIPLLMATVTNYMLLVHKFEAHLLLMLLLITEDVMLFI